MTFERTTSGSRYRLLTQAALWILFAGGGWILLAYAPVNVAFKLWSVGAAGLAIALLRHLPGDAEYRRLANGFGLLFSASVGLSCVQLLNRPMLPLCAFALALGLLLAIRAPGASRLAAISVAVVAAALGIAELIVSGRFSPTRAGVVTEVFDRESGRPLATERFSVLDDVRGFAGRPDTVVKVRWERSKALGYEAVYTLDDQGRRITPGLSTGTPNVVFLGDSFAFGEGVDDADTAPAQLVALEPGLRPMNLGFKAYGPHQALASLEAGLEFGELPAGTPAAGVYYATFDLSRAAGRAFWDTSGPRYVPAADGSLAHAGPFSADRSLRLVALLNRSFLLRRVISTRLNREGDLSLFVAILERSSRLFRERHDGPFLVVLWERAGAPFYSQAVEQLRERAVEAWTIQEIVPNFESDRSDLELLDGHPNRKGHGEVAAFLANRLRRP